MYSYVHLLPLIHTVPKEENRLDNPIMLFYLHFSFESRLNLKKKSLLFYFFDLQNFGNMIVTDQQTFFLIGRIGMKQAWNTLSWPLPKQISLSLRETKELTKCAVTSNSTAMSQHQSNQRLQHYPSIQHIFHAVTAQISPTQFSRVER